MELFLPWGKCVSFNENDSESIHQSDIVYIKDENKCGNFLHQNEEGFVLKYRCFPMGSNLQGAEHCDPDPALKHILNIKQEYSC